MTAGPARAASIIGVFGQSGSGKSYEVKRRVRRAKPPRVLVWDFRREWGGVLPGKVVVTDTLGAMLDAMGARFRVVFQPSMSAGLRDRQFDAFCSLATSMGSCLVVVEELKFVTRPNSSPGAWGLLTSTGRHDRISVIGTSQRPAAVDKDFFGNCTCVRTYKVAFPDDAKVLADSMCLHRSEILSLPYGAPAYAWIESAGGKISRSPPRR